MKMSIRKLFLAICALSIVSFSACVDEDDFDFTRLSETTISPEVEANLLNMTFTSKDFFDQIADTTSGIYLEAQNGVFHLLYKKDFSLSGSDLEHDYFNKDVNMQLLPFSLDDIVIPTWYDDNFSDDFPVVTNQTITIEVDKFAKYEESEQERVIDSLILSSGQFLFAVDSKLPYPVELKVSSEQIVNQSTGKKFDETLTFNAKTKTDRTVDLTNHKLKLNAKADNSSSIAFTYSVVVKTAGKKVESGTYAIDMNLEAKNLNIELAWGLVGNPTIPIQGVIDIDYFADSTIRSDMVDIERLSMIMDITNYTGIQLFLDLDSLKARTHTGLIAHIFDDGKELIVNKAIVPGATALTNETLAVNTKALSLLPNQFIYDIRSIFGDGHQRGFIYPDKKYLDISTLIDLPLTLKVNNFVSEKETDALEFLQDEDGVGDYIDSIALKLSFENAFPTEMIVDIFTKDANGMISPLLNEAVVVKSAKVGSDGKVTSPTTQKNEVYVTHQRYEQLRDADKIIFKASFNTSQNDNDADFSQKPYVSFGDKDYLKVKIGLRAHTSISF